MMSAPPLVYRYVELHHIELRSEVRRGHRAAICQPDASLMRWTPLRWWIATSALITALFGRTSLTSLPSGKSDPVARALLAITDPIA
jgi:hypothetical protein